MEQAPQQKFDFSKYVGVLVRRKWWGIVPIVVLVPATLMVAVALPKKYAAECLLYIGATAAEEEVSYAVRLDRPQIARNKLQDITNRMLTHTNIRGLILGSELTGPIRALAEGIDLTDEEQIEDLYEEIRREVRIDPVGTEYILVSYRGKTPEIALAVVSGLVDKFLDDWLGTVASGYEYALGCRNEEVANLTTSLNLADETLRRFREQHAKELLTSDPDYLVKRLNALEERFSEIEWELAAKKQKQAFLKQRLQETPENRETSAKYERSIMAQKLDQSIADLKITKLLMTDEYTAEHPRVRKQQEKVDLLVAEREKTEDEKTESTIEPNPTYDKYREAMNDVELDIQMLESERQSNTGLRAHVQEDIKKVPVLLEQQSRYQRQILALKNLYAKAQEAKAEAKRRFELSRSAEINAFQKYSIRSSPKPDYGPMLKIAAMGVFATLGLALAAVVGREYLDQSFVTVDDARDFLRIPSLGVVPVIVTPRDVGRRRVRRVVCVITILLLTGATVAACLSIEGLKDRLGVAYEWIARRAGGLWPF